MKYINRLDIVNYLIRCCKTMNAGELERELYKIKNFIEEQDISKLRKLLGS